MKKMLCIWLALACVLGLAGCGGSEKPDASDEMTKEIIALGQTVEKTDEELTGLLEGTSRETMNFSWGEAHGMLSGFWGDMWYTGVGCWYVVVYYEENEAGEGIVSEVKKTENPGVLRLYKEKTPEGTEAEVVDFGMLLPEQVKKLKQIIGQKSRWALDANADRIAFVFDGEFMLEGDETVYRISFDQSILYAEGENPRFCRLTNAELNLLRAFFNRYGWN